MKRFIHKKVNDKFSSRFNRMSIVSNHIKENNDIKEDKVMDTKEKIQMAAAVLSAEQPKVKKVKKEKGLIERTESSITILTEDNRELLKD